MSDRFTHAPSAQRQHRTSPSAETIVRLAPGEDPAHVEAWMRLEHGTLEQIDRVLIAGAVNNATERVRVAPSHISESLARFYGLR
jgi:hypothetical protein